MRDVVCNGPEIRVGSRDRYGVCLIPWAQAVYNIDYYLIIIIFVIAKERRRIAHTILHASIEWKKKEKKNCAY